MWGSGCLGRFGLIELGLDLIALVQFGQVHLNAVVPAPDEGTLSIIQLDARALDRAPGRLAGDLQAEKHHRVAR